MKEMTAVTLTTDSNYVYLPMNQFITNGNISLPLHVNSKGSFTFHYAIWPYICLLTIIIIVWFFLYLSILHARRRLPKHERYRLSSIYRLQDTTIGGGGGGEYEASTMISPLDV